MAQMFGTETGTMDVAANHVDTVSNDVQGELAALKNRLTAVQGAWVGEAKTAFDNLMMRWDEDASKLRVALGDIATNIRTNGAQYSAEQADHVTAINNAGNSGGSSLSL